MSGLEIRYTNREEWHNAALMLIRDNVFSGTEFPKIAVSTGFPSRRALSATKRVIGECFNKIASEDKETFHIFIHPKLSSEVEVLGVLVHEVIHALLPLGTGHKGPFVQYMRKVGLEGKPTATVPGAQLTELLMKLTPEVGKYPHPSLNALSQIKKQSTRMLKITCTECGCIVRMTSKWLTEVGPPTCGCGGRMEE